MSKSRFKSLFSKISFDDFETRTERWKKDRFAAIRNIFEKFNNNCGKSIIPDDLLSIDETLYPMRNKVAFKQSNPNYYSKASMHRVILIHLFQFRTAESLLENQLKNINLVTLK